MGRAVVLTLKDRTQNSKPHGEASEWCDAKCPKQRVAIAMQADGCSTNANMCLPHSPCSITKIVELKIISQ